MTWSRGSAAQPTRHALQGLCFRLRRSGVYEEALADGEVRADERMMKLDQLRFEDPAP